MRFIHSFMYSENKRPSRNMGWAGDFVLANSKMRHACDAMSWLKCVEARTRQNINNTCRRDKNRGRERASEGVKRIHFGLARRHTQWCCIRKTMDNLSTSLLPKPNPSVMRSAIYGAAQDLAWRSLAIPIRWSNTNTFRIEIFMHIFFMHSIIGWEVARNVNYESISTTLFGGSRPCHVNQAEIRP